MTWDNTNGVLNIGQATALTNNPLTMAGTTDSWIQVNVQNKSTTANASSDYVATADTGNDSANYIDLGINSSVYSNSSYSSGGALDGYLYTNGGHLTLGTQTATKQIKMFTGGTLAANIRATLSDSALNLATGVQLQQNGAPIVPNVVQVSVGFGLVTGPGDTASASVPATWVTSTSVIVCSVDAAIGTADHAASDEDPVIEEIHVAATGVTAGVGFTVTAYAPSGSSGAYLINCVGL